METHLQCFPCLVRQFVDMAERAHIDEETSRRLLREVLNSLATADHSMPPPILTRVAFDLVVAASGNPDPLAAEKRWANDLVLSLLPNLEKQVAEAADPFDAAVRLSVAGNVVDLGAKRNVSREEVVRALEEATEVPLRGLETKAFAKLVSEAERILFLTDNAGEVVLDRLLLDRLPPGRITVAVRGAPTINDATMEDADHAGLVGRYPVIDNGAPYAGTHVPSCSPEFRRVLDEADLIIAKGQGNYETLNTEQRPIMFLFKVKCEGVSRLSGLPVGSLACLPSETLSAQKNLEAVQK